ncbi:hypothetical protein N480_01355 [Pseudoalteromonas luteoviolacea S2607]|uniref:GNAT family N-acetyltransferase n=1 Tax=Pseudoalteromonas luteoviolacea TaxID=43657 RepID=UPI0007B04D8D|nr:GNAT family N-acetyltransferase [Pseudoalteromonas luteoviolacea]KZN39510.1 hypothetical protein N480_01355 [Pseudoalteromonas luteoviolacea S2607]
MKSKYKLVSCELDAQWDQFVARSPHGSAFSMSQFIATIDVKVHSFYCCKGNEKIAAILLIVSDDGCSVIGHHDVIYDGIIHRNTRHLNKAQTHSEMFSAQEFISQFLADNYQQVHLKLHPNIVDIRAFQWVNYHNDGKKYSTNIRYTSVLEISEFENPDLPFDDSQCYLNSSVSRRQEIRYGLKKGVSVYESKQYDLFAQFYALTMSRQEIDISQQQINKLAHMIEVLHSSGLLLLVEAKDQSGRIGSFASYLILNDTAYYFYGANDPQMRDSHTGTAVLWQSIPLLVERGARLLDLEGINSPKRGWFKLSFGGEIISYFHLHLG